jgi:predicted nicotinamide N-methyase
LIENCDAFIRANTRLSHAPLQPSIKLYLAEEGTPLRLKTEHELEYGFGPPPFWAFAWPGGQALASFITDRPEVVAGKRVLDLAAGCGLVAIAAARAGARQIAANDIDCFAAAAIAMNAVENAAAVEVLLGDLVGSHEPWDVILAGDVAYQRNMADPMTIWLEARAKAGALVLIGDPGRAFLPQEKLRSLACYDVPVPFILEDVAMKQTGVWSFI